TPTKYGNSAIKCAFICSPFVDSSRQLPLSLRASKWGARKEPIRYPSVRQ
uniref:ENTH domain-containing protein n=1 Tax=Parascaris univalens TaxID=6257 RepID=A0A915CA39_PARUN